MKWTVTWLCILAVFATTLYFLVPVAFAQKEMAASSGYGPYQPSKLDWMYIFATARHHNRDTFSSGGFSIAVQSREPDTILLRVVTNPSRLNRKHMNEMMALTREDIESYAQGKGWEWLKVREIYNAGE